MKQMRIMMGGWIKTEWIMTWVDSDTGVDTG